jgi:prepilin-type N-terminal cleavage/methylation domain-containing protein
MPFRPVQPPAPRTGFTLVELLVGMSLALIMMTAVLLSYVFIGRNFTRSLGITSKNQPTIESQGRQAVTYFSQDVRMATGIDTSVNALSASSLTLTVPTSTGTKPIAYYYNSTASAVTLTLITSYSTTVPAQSLVRVDGSTGRAMTLHTNLLSFTFTYYDASGNPYTTYVNYLSGIKQISISFTAQAGSSTNGTLTQVYRGDSARMILRNRRLLY